ncbi:MAG: cell division protein FtsA [Clostridia bacterium]|nr:cell division protein FtsA [Clostridia bacterium]
MAVNDIIVGMDIGSSKVSLYIGKINNFNQIETMSNIECKCNGIKKGKIIDENEISLAISKVIQNAENEIGMKINSTYLTIPGKYITIVQNSIVKEVKDRYAGISVKDVTSSIKLVKDIDVPEGSYIIDVVADTYILDNGKVVQDPVGSLSSKFTVNGQVILAEREYVKQITSILKKAGLEIDGIIPITLAERNFILDNNELNENILLLDVGAENTEIGIFDGNSYLYTNTIPLGGNSITKDISLVLDISEEEADKLKRQYGLALRSYIDNDNEILLTTPKGDSKGKVIKSSELIEIMEARIEEIFTIINKDIMMQGLKSKINGVILTGQGITNINKSDVAGKIILNIPVKIATGRLVSTIRPEYRTAYSLVRYIAGKAYMKTVSSSIEEFSENNFLRKTLEKVREFFYS